MADKFTPFMVGTQAQNIINDFLDGKLTTSPNVNSAGKFRNPQYDIRTEQEKAGTLDPTADFPNPQIDYSSVPDTPVDPCPPGFMLVDGVCQPIEQFGQSAYQENNDRDDPEERPYMSIEQMKNATDEELLEYLKDGRLSNSLLGFLPSKGNIVTIKDSKLTSPFFKLAFGKQEEMRRQFMIDELTKRGFNIGTNKDGQQQFNINPILYNENLNDAVSSMNYRQDNSNDNVPVIREDGTIGYKSVDRTGGDFYQQTRPTENLGSLLSNDGSRNQDNYNKALRENVRRTVLAPTQTISYRDPDTNKTYTANAPRSNYSSTLGGFTGGR